MTSPTPAEPLNLQDAELVMDLFDRAAEAQLAMKLRSGATVDLPQRGKLLMTGDLHDHTLNYQRLVKLARLNESAENYLVLHEIVHGPNHVNGCDLSVRLLARAAALVLEHPQQVFMLLSNHELAQRGGEGILKGGHSVVDAFDAGLAFLYQEDAEDVRESMNRFIESMLLAVRCANGIFASHSLPSPRKIEKFDKSVVERTPTKDDLAVGGSAYLMVWGRHHNQKIADELAEAWQAKIFVMGHQPAEMGYEAEGETMLILASDHEHGQALPIELDKQYSRDELIDYLIPLAGVVV